MTRFPDKHITEKEDRQWRRLIEGSGNRRKLKHNKEMAREIRAFQSAHGMSLMDLSHALGVSYRTLHSWVAGDYPIRHPKMLLLALKGISISSTSV